MHCRLACRFVAVLTAQAVLLSLLFPVIAPAAPAIGDPAFQTICSGAPHRADSDGPGRQGSVYPCCGAICAACTHATYAELGGPGARKVIYPRRASVAVFAEPAQLDPILPKAGRPHAARAPPAMQSD
jgi:hypothetical protein